MQENAGDAFRYSGTQNGSSTPSGFQKGERIQYGPMDGAAARVVVVVGVSIEVPRVSMMSRDAVIQI